MNLVVQRKYKKDTYTIGKLFIDGNYFCDTLEDRDRGLEATMLPQEIAEKKIYGETAIPTGKYAITLAVISPKFSQYAFYMEICQGKLPRLINVPGYEGVLLHVADGPKGAELVHGCIGVGKNKIKGGLINGKETFKNLYHILQEADNRGESIMIKIE